MVMTYLDIKALNIANLTVSKSKVHFLRPEIGQSFRLSQS